MKLKDYALSKYGYDWLSTTMNYAAANAAEGHIFGEASLTRIDDINSAITSQGATLRRGWMFGDKLNLPTAAGKQLELTGSGADFVHMDTADSAITVGGGSLALVGDTAFKGYLTCNEPLFDNTDWTMLFLVNKPTRDSASGSSEGSFLISQFTAHVNGKWYLEGDHLGRVSAQWIGATGDGWGEPDESARLQPAIVWGVHNAATRTITYYDPFTGAETGNQIGPVGGFISADFEIGKSSSSLPPRIAQVGFFLLFDGQLTETQRDGIFAAVYDGHAQFANHVLIYGNSCAYTGFPTSESWPQKFKVWGATHNCFTWMPEGMGAKSLYNYRPTGYTLPAPRQAVLGNFITVPVDPTLSVDQYVDKRIHIIVNDENQNTAPGLGLDSGSSAEMLYSDYTHIWDAICDALPDPDLKLVQGTMMAWALGASNWAAVSTDTFLANLRDWSVAIRIDARYDAVAETYGDFNMGWDTPDDGNPPAPLTDLPNGDPTLFLTDDRQHPDNDGHAIMATNFQDAVDSVRRT